MAKANGKKSKKKIIVFGGLFLLLLAVAAVVILSGDKEKIVKVQTEKVQKRTITQTVSATGKINPVDQVILRPEVNGEIVELPVEEGDFVKKGQLLIKFKPDIYIAQKKRAQANLQAAKANLRVREATLNQVRSEYQRSKELFAKGLISESELEKAEASYLQSEGSYEAQKSTVLQSQESLREAYENLAKTEILAPFDGTISELNVELSERVLGSSFSQGTQLMTVADLSKMEATVDVDENDVVLVSVGDTAKIEIDAFGDKKFMGRVTQIGNSAKTSGLGSQDEVVNFEVKIRLLELDKEIRPGMSCDAEIETETKMNVVAVPIQSVTARMPKPKADKDGEKSGGRKEFRRNKMKNGKRMKPVEVVFVVEDNKAKKVPVKTGISDDSFIEIVSGLEEGAEVVSGPYRAISKELEDDVKVALDKSKRSFGDKKKKED